MAAEVATVVPHVQPASVQRDRHRTRRWIWASGISAGLAGIWALWPQTHKVVPIAIAPVPERSKNVEPLDLKAFDAPMWTLAALPPPPPPPPAPPPALLEQLLAVSLSDNAPTAMFYRPIEDRILTLHVGDSIGGRTIKAITTDKVTLVWKPGTKNELVESLFTDPRNAPGATGGSP